MRTDYAGRVEAVAELLDLDDRMVDMVEEGYDMAIRIARLPDSSLIAGRLRSLGKSRVCIYEIRTVAPFGCAGPVAAPG